MIARRALDVLPGPRPVQFAVAAVLLIVAFIALMFLYDWMGNTLLDSGGTIS